MNGFFIFIFGVIVGWFLNRIYTSFSCTNHDDIRSIPLQSNSSPEEVVVHDSSSMKSPPPIISPKVSPTPESESPSTFEIDSSSNTDEKAEQCATSNQADNLTRIKGIGPKISKAFNEKGILTFADLANLSQEEVIQILEQSDIRIVNKQLLETIPEQAKLAAANDWEQFNTLGNSL